jgi:trans-aconitate methyltransferase
MLEHCYDDKFMQTYQWNAVEYAKSSGVQQQWARELIRKLNLNGNETLLDIGSGDGKVTAEIATHLPNGSVVGIDSSEEMIKLAQQTYARDAFPNLQFQQEDATRLSFENKFNIVFSNATLHWILDHRPVLCGIFASLRHGGKVLLQMGGCGNAGEVMDALTRIIKKEEWRKFFDGFSFSYGFYSPDEYRVWLREAELVARRVELIPKDAEHQGRSGFESWIRTTWLPYIQQVPVEKRELFVSQLADEYLQHHSVDENGKVHVKMVRLEIEALKL